MSADRPVVRRPNQVAGAETSAGVTVREMLNDGGLYLNHGIHHEFHWKRTSQTDFLYEHVFDSKLAPLIVVSAATTAVAIVLVPLLRLSRQDQDNPLYG